MTLHTVLKLCFGFALLLLIGMPAALYAQKSTVSVLAFTDAKTGQAIAEVQLLDTAENKILEADEQGIVVLADKSLNGQRFIARAAHYYADTFKIVGTMDTLHRLMNQVPEAPEVGAGEVDMVRRVLKSKSDKVLDYDFEGSRYIVLKSIGVLGRRQSLSLSDAAGNLLSSCEVPDKAKKLYRSCMGGRYLIGRDSVQRIIIDEDKISVGASQEIEKFLPLTNCQLKVENEYYLRHVLADTVGAVFSYLAKSGAKPEEFYKTMDTNYTLQRVAALRYYEDRLRNDPHAAFAVNQRVEYIMNKPRALQDRNLLYMIGDTILIVDINHKSFKYFDRFSRQLQRSVAIQFPFEKQVILKVLKDELRERIYLHTEVGESGNTIQEININDGTLIGKPMRIGRRWASGIKVNNGNVYFLYQNRAGSNTPEPKGLWMQALQL